MKGGWIMKSMVISFSSIARKIAYFASIVYEDRLTVYAAQTSFYICISVIPFVLLVLSLARALAPQLVSDVVELLRAAVPEGAKGVFDTVTTEASERPILSIASVTTAATLWSAAKGLTAVVRGLSEVYGTRARGTYFINVFRGLIFTVLFIAAISVTLLLLVVFESASGASDRFLPPFLRTGYKGLIVFAMLTLFFSLLYYFVARGSFFTKRPGRAAAKAPKSFAGHIAGAAVASAGWIVYSFFYSLYFKFFTGSSYIYGSLAAIVLLMLWVYFCAVIFLFGAEINKALFLTKNQ